MLKIYTKTGDDGTTGLQGGKRVSKSNIRIMAYGAVDEVNSTLGIVLSHDINDDIRELLTKIQHDLFVIGSDLSDPKLNNRKFSVNKEKIDFLEKTIDQFEENLLPITKFILPGGNHVSALIHFSRAVTRRAETMTVLLSEKEKINQNCILYLNRLSDLLFVIGRTINKRAKSKDVFWNH